MRGSRPNGTHTNGEAPPPSTLAAQIVQNQTTTRASQQSGEKATFSGLLHEILHSSSATPETDIGVNVQLISVVVEAGLSILARDDPFAQLDLLLPQATDSLAVVKATIVRQPEVLFAPIGQDGPPLVVWLLARLFPLCGRSKCDGLPIAGLINSAISVLGSSKLWRSAADVQGLIRECINGMWTLFCTMHVAVYSSFCRHYRLTRNRRCTCQRSLGGTTSRSVDLEAVA
jgi:serine/threonine-protein kinase ATR